MTELSPQAQAVRDAVLATYADNIPKDDRLWALERDSVVVALRSVADQPYEVPNYIHGDSYWIYRAGVEAERNRNLSIAAELEGAQTEPPRHHIFPTPHQIAECGGPCEQGGPEACDCGLYGHGTSNTTH